jgi:hypothetical protein
VRRQKSVWKLKNYSLSFPPTRDQALKPKQVLLLSVTFQPNQRVPSFTEKLLADCGYEKNEIKKKKKGTEEAQGLLPLLHSH